MSYIRLLISLLAETIQSRVREIVVFDVRDLTFESKLKCPKIELRQIKKRLWKTSL